MMLASVKFSLTFFCLVWIFFLYNYNHFSTPSNDYDVAPPNTSEVIIVDPQTSAAQNDVSSNSSSSHAEFVLEAANRGNVSEKSRSRILQATMMFGNTYLGLNERTLQTHSDHAKRWGYGDHILRREIVGTGQWDKFIFSKILHLLNLIIGELKKPTKERAEWVV